VLNRNLSWRRLAGAVICCSSFALPISLAADGGGAARGAAPAKSELKRDPKAVEVLRSACELVSKLDAYTTTCHMTRVEGDREMGRRLEVKSTITYRKPRSLRVVSEPPVWTYEGKPYQPELPLAVSDLYIDGDKAVYVMPALGEYIEGPNPDRVSAIFEEMAYPAGTNFAGITVFPVFLMHDPMAMMMRGPWGLEYVGRETLDGVEAHVLRQRTEGLVDLKIWIGADRPLFLQFATDTSRADAEKVQVLTSLFTIRFRDWDVNPKLEDRMFAFEPAANLKMVESFSEPLPPPPAEGPQAPPASAPGSN
jgi:hypothetical protein